MGKFPNFIIIGAQKCGTTNLYKNLIKHPYIAPALVKEVHFFDINFQKGLNWYYSHFISKHACGHKLITGEASPYYIFHPHVPKRISKIIPKVKLIVLLRNPVDRAYSHYYHEVRIGVEHLSFEEAIQKESERLKGEVKKILSDENYFSFNYIHYSYLARGVYIKQLQTWFQFFPREQFLIIKTENFFRNPSSVYKQILEFLELPIWEPDRYEDSHNKYPPMDIKIRKFLKDFFKPYNKQLYELLGTDFKWDEK